MLRTRFALLLSFVLGLTLPLTHAAAQAPSDLPRRGTIGIGLQPGDDGAMIVAVVRPGGPADKAGLKAGDRLVSFDGSRVTSQAQLAELLRTRAGGSAVPVVVDRDDKQTTLPVTLDPAPKEAVPGSTVSYSSVTVPAGYRLRTIISTPDKAGRDKAGSENAGSSGKYPGFLFVQGIYCASLDRPQAPDAVDTRLIRAMADAGFITMRVDKPGLGDSEGPNCGDIDFQTELAGYSAALKQLQSLPNVDPDRIYIFGHSMGGVMAPYLLAQPPVKGAIVYGTLARTWFEYQLENTRRQMALGGASQSDITQAVQAEAISSAMILVDKKTLGDVWSKYPELRSEGPMMEAERMSSRHMSFYHQLQDLNLAKGWEGVKSNVLAIHGEYDWVTTKEDHDLIAQIVNASAPGKGTSLSLARADHAFTLHDSLNTSLSAMGQGEWDGSLPKAVLAWIDTVEGRTPTPAKPAQAQPAAEPEAPNAAKAAKAAATANAKFPDAWLGHWKGEAENSDGTGRSQKFTTELIIKPTDKPDRYTWTIIYSGAAGKQERPYTLVVKDAAKGQYAIDEANGIVLDARLLNGALYSHFLVQGNRITTRDRLEDAGTPDERITIEMLTTSEDAATITGNQNGIPEVKSWSPLNIQRATLRRIDGAKAEPAKPDAGKADANKPAAAAEPPNPLPAWKKLTTEKYPGKQDDIFFINPTTGWYVNGAGKIFKTTDGGETWAQKLHKPGTFFRCIAFVDEKLGFAGNIGPGYFPNVSDTVPLYRTEDGGDTWSPVTTIDGPPIVGLCSIKILKEEFVNAGNLDTRVRIIAVGRVGGPSVMITSDDRGGTFKQLPIEGAGMALDVHFFDRDRGLVAAASSTDVSVSNALILATTDGGKTWTKAYQSNRPYELTWKISFPSRQTGYVTVQSFNPDQSASQRFVAKTTDGGTTWTELPLVDDFKVREFGLAFADDNTGWIGAVPGGFQTTDGGKSWMRMQFGNAVNKVFLVKTPTETVGFAIGVDVYKVQVPGGLLGK